MKMSKKSQIAILVLNQSPISVVFPIARFAGDQKDTLTGDPLYHPKMQQYISGIITPNILV